MKVELICVGNELLSGKTLNTNASYISKRLSELGHTCSRQFTVDDNKERIIEAVNSSLPMCDILILTGGLGPTDDDLTKEAVAQALKLKLVENSICKKHLEDYFAALGKKPTSNNFKQITSPEGATIFKNKKGTACGIGIEYKRKKVFLLPGPPKELTNMFDSYIVPYLQKIATNAIVSHTINVFGMVESSIETLIKPYCNLGNPVVATYCKDCECDIVITATADTAESAEEICLHTISKIREILGDCVYGVDSKGLASQTVNLLRNSGLKVATAESCTGGMLSQSLTSVSGASEVVEIGILAYSNRIKKEALSVPISVLMEEGAISAETAMYMAKNVKILSDSDIGVGITGNAGPMASEGKPVGLVYVSIADKTKYYIKKLELPEKYGREKIRLYATLAALDLIRRYVLHCPDVLCSMKNYDDGFSFEETKPVKKETAFTLFEVDEDYENEYISTPTNSDEYIFEAENDANIKSNALPNTKPLKISLALLKKHWVKIVGVVCLVALILCSTLLVGTFVHEGHQKALIENARKNFDFSLLEKNDSTGKYTAFNALLESNSEVKAWLTIDGTDINNPVYQAKDNKYYQSHNMAKEKSPYGALFFDCNNIIEENNTNQNLTIYGHNTKNNTMFGGLDSYHSLSFYKSNPTVKLKTLYDTGEYLVFAVIIANAVPEDDNGQLFNYTKTHFADDADFEDFISQAKSRSIISVPMEINADDTILTLSTRSDEFDNARFVVMAKRITSDEEKNYAQNAVLNSNARYPQAWYDKNNLIGFTEDKTPSSTPESSKPSSSEQVSSEEEAPTHSSKPSSSTPSSSKPSSATPTACVHKAPNVFTDTLDTIHHSFKCTKCSQTVNESHSFSVEKIDGGEIASSATCTEAAKYYKFCKCGAKGTETFTSGEPNKHEASENLDFDDENHWNTCVGGCNEHWDEEPHTFNNGTCGICGKEEPVITP